MFLPIHVKKVDGTAYPEFWKVEKLPMGPDFYTARDLALGRERPYADAKEGDVEEIIYYNTTLLPVRWWCLWRVWTKPYYPPYVIAWKLV